MCFVKLSLYSLMLLFWDEIKDSLCLRLSGKELESITLEVHELLEMYGVLYSMFCSPVLTKTR